ncbi:MAG: helix-hairpin-helix domain-containing protein [Armatimonadota bacterium]
MWNYNKKQIIIVGAGLLIIAILSLVLNNHPAPVPEEAAPEEITITNPDGSNAVLGVEASEASVQPQTVYVHVTGRVKTPGVYNLKPDSRIKDAVHAAGGPVSNADLESINLAQKLEDGMQVYIARTGEIPKPAVSVVSGGTSTGSSSISSKPASGSKAPSVGEAAKLSKPGSGNVNINSASQTELQRLPGIGPSMAQRILEYRTANGRFSSVDELDEVKGIGPAKLAKMRPFITL